MAFSAGIVKHRFHLEGGECEICGRRLAWLGRGKPGVGMWQAHPKDGNPDNNTLANCEIICWPCRIVAFPDS